MTLTRNMFKISFFHIKWAAGSRNLFNSLHANSMVSFHVRVSFYFKFFVSYMMHLLNAFYLFLLFCCLLCSLVVVFFVLFLFIFHFSLFSSFFSARSLSRLATIYLLSTLQLSEEINMKLLPIISLHLPATGDDNTESYQLDFFYPHLTSNSQN